MLACQISDVPKHRGSEESSAEQSARRGQEVGVLRDRQRQFPCAAPSAGQGRTFYDLTALRLASTAPRPQHISCSAPAVSFGRTQEGPNMEVGWANLNPNRGGSLPSACGRLVGSALVAPSIPRHQPPPPRTNSHHLAPNPATQNQPPPPRTNPHPPSAIGRLALTGRTSSTHKRCRTPAEVFEPAGRLSLLAVAADTDEALQRTSRQKNDNYGCQQKIETKNDKLNVFDRLMRLMSADLGPPFLDGCPGDASLRSR